MLSCDPLWKSALIATSAPPAGAGASSSTNIVADDPRPTGDGMMLTEATLTKGLHIPECIGTCAAYPGKVMSAT